MSRALAAMLLLAATACNGIQERPPAEKEEAGRSLAPDAATQTAGVPAFNAQRAHELIRRQVAFGPRVPGAPGHARQLQWMEGELRTRADTLILQDFTHTTGSGRSLRMTNLLARFGPELPDRILLVAHWDTRPTADQERDPARRRQPIPGANDGGSGTAVLLELADVLSRHSPPIGVDLLFVDGEDYGPGEMYLGATHFAANLPPGYRPLYGVVVDLVADEDPTFPVEGYSAEYAPEVVDRVWSLAARLGYGHIFRRESGGAVSDDHVPLNRAGIRAIDIIDFDYGPGNRYWHTLEDSFEHTSPRGLEAVGAVLAALVYSGG
ncbi:MAG: M28 family peptidase [Gemmatimonadetes bacterium]|nr:M28 family peptidase [Gemmatimonadota bacterium]